LLGGVAGALLATADSWAEARVNLPASWQYSASTATGILTAVVGAMVGLFGFVVTISVLVVQMATGTLSPRFMRLWYRDRLQKLVLALFIGTVAFAFRLLRAIDEDTVPSLGVTVAGLLFGTSLILLLLYLNRFAHNLRPVGVGALVARQGLREAAAARSARAAVAAGLQLDHVVEPETPGRPSAKLGFERDGGAVLAVNVRGLVAEAVRADCLIVLDLVLAVTEIRDYGPTSIQVCRRLRAMLEDLAPHCTPADRVVVAEELSKLDRAVVEHFSSEDLAHARTPDRQGIGAPRRS